MFGFEFHLIIDNFLFKDHFVLTCIDFLVLRFILDYKFTVILIHGQFSKVFRRFKVELHDLTVFFTAT